MPAIPLMRVDLPAPLSPTRAVTCPAQASRFTPLSTCTAPKLFWIPRRLSRGVVLGVVGVLSVMLPRSWNPARRGARRGRWDRCPRTGPGTATLLCVQAGGRTRAGPAPGLQAWSSADAVGGAGLLKLGAVADLRLGGEAVGDD